MYILNKLSLRTLFSQCGVPPPAGRFPYYLLTNDRNGCVVDIIDEFMPK